jgi:transposase-like protein
MTSSSASAFAGFRFPREVISVAVRWYLRYGLSYRDVEELLAERGVTVDHVTVYRWVQRFTPEFVEAARTCRHVPGDRWFVDETYVKVNGRWTYLYRAIDQYGQVIDVWLSARRDLTAARTFFTRALALGAVPVEVTTDRAPAYPRVLTNLSRSPGMTPSGTRTTESKPTTVGSKPGFDRCGVSRPSDQHGSLPPATPSCRTSDAATTTSPPTHRSITGYRRRSLSWPWPSDSPAGDRSAMPPDRPKQRRLSNACRP